MRRVSIRTVASEQTLQFLNVSWLDQVRSSAGGDAPVSDVGVRIATEGNQAELRGRKPQTKTTTEL